MGFFRVSGFKHLWDIIAPSDNPSKIDEFSSIRLLVGIEADKFAHLASNFALNSHDETKQKAFFKAYKDEFCARQSDDSLLRTVEKARNRLTIPGFFMGQF